MFSKAEAKNHPMKQEAMSLLPWIGGCLTRTLGNMLRISISGCPNLISLSQSLYIRVLGGSVVCTWGVVDWRQDSESLRWRESDEKKWVVNLLGRKPWQVNSSEFIKISFWAPVPVHGTADPWPYKSIDGPAQLSLHQRMRLTTWEWEACRAAENDNNVLAQVPISKLKLWATIPTISLKFLPVLNVVAKTCIDNNVSLDSNLLSPNPSLSNPV